MPAQTRSSRQSRRQTRTTSTRSRTTAKSSSATSRRKPRVSTKSRVRPRSRRPQQRSQSQPLQFGWLRAVIFWIILLLVLIFLAVRTVLPALIQNTWLFGDSVQSEQVVLVADESSRNLFVIHQVPGFRESGLWRIEPTDIARWEWLEQPFAAGDLENSEEDGVLSSDELWESISRDQTLGARIFSQNTGLPVTSLIVLHADSSPAGGVLDNPPIAWLRQKLRERAFAGASSGMSVEKKELLRLWLVTHLATSMKTETIENIRNQLQRLRIEQATQSLQECQIAVLNGTTTAGLSARFSRGLEQQGFVVVRVGQSPETTRTTQLIVSPEKDSACAGVINIVRRFLPEERQASIESTLPSQYRAPIVVLLGEDLGLQSRAE